MITPRTTRLVRAADLRCFRSALAALATDGSPLDARNRLVIVPTRAGAAHLIHSIEDRVAVGAGAVILPDFITRADLHERLFDRLVEAPRKGAPYNDHRRAGLYAPPYTAAEREALLALACRAARSRAPLRPSE